MQPTPDDFQIGARSAQIAAPPSMAFLHSDVIFRTNQNRRVY